MSKSVLNNSSFLKSGVAVPPYEVSQRQEKLKRKTEREKTKGKDWFDMPTGEMTEEAKNDLMMLKMRSGLHKDKFFKSNDTDTLPKFFQVCFPNRFSEK
jgi:hypothetical protein